MFIKLRYWTLYCTYSSPETVFNCITEWSKCRAKIIGIDHKEIKNEGVGMICLAQGSVQRRIVVLLNKSFMPAIRVTDSRIIVCSPRLTYSSFNMFVYYCFKIQRPILKTSVISVLISLLMIRCHLFGVGTSVLLFHVVVCQYLILLVMTQRNARRVWFLYIIIDTYVK